jgi:hypothetical protein
MSTSEKPFSAASDFESLVVFDFELLEDPKPNQDIPAA